MANIHEVADVAIVGGGASGTLAASHLLRSGAGTGSVVLIERRAKPGLGVAYSTEEPVHLLNVPAGGMSGVHDQPNHLVDWLREAGIPAGAGDFVPRATYGRYLRAVLDDAERDSTRSLIRIRGSVMDARTDGDGALLQVPDGEPLRARRVVFALGNPPPGTPSFLQALGERHVADPWAAPTLRRVGLEESVLLVGTGLTAIDAALTLTAGGHRGPIHMVSRHGLLPQVHRVTAGGPRPLRALSPPPSPLSIRRLVRWIRDEVRVAEADGADWRDVMRSVRPLTQRLWMQLPMEERRIFLRHVQRLWSVHRHRMAPGIGRAVEGLRESGQLTVHVGGIRIEQGADGFDVEITPRGEQPIRLHASWIVNCTGPDLDPSRSTEPLVRSLLERGEVRRDPLGLGFDCTPEGAVIDSSGTPSQTLWAIGPLRTGSLWESTAVPEIREQAANLVTQVDRKSALVSGEDR
jgi:uncharacterized NAD(P)/FAD-binding protein YdhS